MELKILAMPQIKLIDIVQSAMDSDFEDAPKIE